MLLVQRYMFHVCLLRPGINLKYTRVFYDISVIFRLNKLYTVVFWTINPLLWTTRGLTDGIWGSTHPPAYVKRLILV